MYYGMYTTEDVTDGLGRVRSYIMFCCEATFDANAAAARPGVPPVRIAAVRWQVGNVQDRLTLRRNIALKSSSSKSNVQGQLFSFNFAFAFHLFFGLLSRQLAHSTIAQHTTQIRRHVEAVWKKVGGGRCRYHRSQSHAQHRHWQSASQH